MARIGYTASKKVGGAVLRNRAKRRLRAAAQALGPRLCLQGVDYVFIARRDTPERSWSALLDDVETALIRLAATVDKSARPSASRPSAQN